MSKPLPALLDQHFGAHFVPRLKQKLWGLAEDFWVDGPHNFFDLDISFGQSVMPTGLLQKTGLFRKKETVQEAAAAKAVSSSSPQKPKPGWHAEPGEISEKMWGPGCVTPGDNMLNAQLIGPLGLTRERSVLDLSAGLGARLRQTVEETGCYITGLEPDPAIAARGMQMSVRAGKSKQASIAVYDPGKLVLSRSYDCVIVRETFYRAPDRASFYATIAQHTKPHAQLAYTDYIVDPEHRDKPGIKAWLGYEKLAKPASLVESAEQWGKAGFALRIHEDLTDFYKAEVTAGMKRLMSYLAGTVAKGLPPDKETALAVLRRIEIWKYRLGAMQDGMKFYRFFGTKQ